MNGTGESFTGPVSFVCTEVAKIYGVSLIQLIGPQRARSVSWPRQVAMYVAHEQTGQSTTQIGRVMGGRDHSTVVAGIQRVRTEMKRAPYRRREVQIAMAVVKQDTFPEFVAHAVNEHFREQLIASLRQTIADCTLTLRCLGVEDTHGAT